MAIFNKRINVKNNIITVDEENTLFLSKKLFQILFYLLHQSKEKEVKYSIYEIILFYSDNSGEFINYCIEEPRYIEKIFQLTYDDFTEIKNNSLIILDNIFNNDKYDSTVLENILQKYPIIERCKELLSNYNLGDDLKINCLEILYTFSYKLEKKYIENYFYDCINIFYNIITWHKKNEDIFIGVLKICEKITIEDQICMKIKEVGLIDIFLINLSTPNLERDCLNILINIFCNLFYLNEIINYCMIEKKAEIINIFIMIINTYMNTCNENDNKFIVELFLCISNIACGPEEAQYILSKSDLPRLIIQMMKIKNNNNIHYEGIQIIVNLMTDCNRETFDNISKLNPLKIFAKALIGNSKVDNIKLYLSGIIKLIENNNKFYGTLEYLKKEFYNCLINKTIEDLMLHNNNEISEMAKKIFENLEDELKMDD